MTASEEIAFPLLCRPPALVARESLGLHRWRKQMRRYVENDFLRHQDWLRAYHAAADFFDKHLK